MSEGQYTHYPKQNGGGGSGTVTSVGLSAPSSILSVSGSPVTTSGTLALSLVVQNANKVWAGPTTGADANPTFRTLVAADIPTLPYLSTTLGTANGLSVSVNTLSLGLSSTSTTGALSSTDWNTFNGKQAALTIGDITDAGTDGIVITGGTGAIIGSGVTLAQHVADSTHNGYLSSTDWSTFNNKGSGSVTSVALSVPATSIFGVTGSPVTTTGTLGLTTTGTSGGVPYFSSTSALSSSALLTANALILGGGAGAAPAALGSLGTTTTVLHGNASGAPTFGAVVLTTDVSGVLPIANGGTNSTATPTAGGIGYGTGTAHAYTSAGTSSDWVLSAGSSAPTISSTTTTAKTIDGSSDTVQLIVEGNATQTSNILDVQKSDATKLLSVTNVNGTAIRGTTTNDSAAAGFVGEILQSTQTATNFPTSDQYGDLTSLSITAGDWLVTIVTQQSANGATTINQAIYGISTTSGNSSTGLTAGVNQIDGPVAVNGTRSAGACIANYHVQLSATTTHYLKYRASYSGGTPQCAGRITALRIR